MALKGHCGRSCGACTTPCKLDLTIPCSPDCQNLTKDGKIKVGKCLAAGCEEVKYIFEMENASDEEVLAQYGEVTQYPY